MTKKADLQKQWELREKAKQQKLSEEQQAKEALEQKQVPENTLLFACRCAVDVCVYVCMRGCMYERMYVFDGTGFVLNV